MHYAFDRQCWVLVNVTLDNLYLKLTQFKFGIHDMSSWHFVLMGPSWVLVNVASESLPLKLRQFKFGVFDVPGYHFNSNWPQQDSGQCGCGDFASEADAV